MATYVDFAFVSSAATQDADQVCLWRCTKHRRRPPVTDATIHVEGRFGQIVDWRAHKKVTSDGRQVNLDEARENYKGDEYREFERRQREGRKGAAG